ncbi:polymer-forming cytoskeletal protein [Shewanella maritima]|uniref:polymer-forming cytoskeletal protein n=1 Tax=Shewanella maritima TaxID=2520507 RepID=UPI00373685B9
MSQKTKQVTYINAQMHLEGEMQIQGAASIAGKTRGVIRSTEIITIEQGGDFDGELFCQELHVSGVVKGKAYCDKLIIVAGGTVDGEVSCHHMEIHDGGQFIGMRKKGPSDTVLPQIVKKNVAKSATYNGQTDSAEQSNKTATSPQPTKQTSSTSKAKPSSVVETPSTSSEAVAKTNVNSQQSSKKSLWLIVVIVILILLIFNVDFDSMVSEPEPQPEEPTLFNDVDSSSTGQMDEVERQAALQAYQAQKAKAAQQAKEHEQNSQAAAQSQVSTKHLSALQQDIVNLDNDDINAAPTTDAANETSEEAANKLVTSDSGITEIVNTEADLNDVAEELEAASTSVAKPATQQAVSVLTEAVETQTEQNTQDSAAAESGTQSL